MSIQTIKTLLEEMMAVGINEAIIEPEPNGTGTLIRAADENQSIIMYDTLEEKLVDYPLAIQSVRGLYSRINLFDLNTASVKFEHDSKEIKNIVIKQGKRKVTFKPSRVSLINAPKAIPDLNLVGNEIEFTGDYGNTVIMPILNSIALTGNKKESMVSLSVTGGQLEMTFFDGEDDSAVEVQDVQGGDIQKSSWETQAFKCVLKQAIDRNTTVKFSVTDIGIAIFEMFPVTVMIAPMAA